MPKPTPRHRIDIQRINDHPQLPTDKQLKQWAKVALSLQTKPCELTLRLVDRSEMTELNQHYRSKTGPTNVLSFPFEAPPGVRLNCLGDVIICMDVVISEAAAQSKAINDHFAHLLIHGILHLLGYDHIEPQDAEVMEAEEIKLLAGLGIGNPYLIQA